MPDIMMNQKDAEQVDKLTEALNKLSPETQDRFSDWMDGFTAGLNLGQKECQQTDKTDGPAA